MEEQKRERERNSKDKQRAVKREEIDSTTYKKGEWISVGGELLKRKANVKFTILNSSGS